MNARSGVEGSERLGAARTSSSPPPDTARRARPRSRRPRSSMSPRPPRRPGTSTPERLSHVEDQRPEPLQQDLRPPRVHQQRRIPGRQEPHGAGRRRRRRPRPARQRLLALPPSRIARARARRRRLGSPELQPGESPRPCVTPARTPVGHGDEMLHRVAVDRRPAVQPRQDRRGRRAGAPTSPTAAPGQVDPHPIPCRRPCPAAPRSPPAGASRRPPGPPGAGPPPLHLLRPQRVLARHTRSHRSAARRGWRARRLRSGRAGPDGSWPRSSVACTTSWRSSAPVTSARASPRMRDHEPTYIDGAYCAWMAADGVERVGQRELAAGRAGPGARAAPG